MANLPELTRLFTKLALELRRPAASAVNDDGDDETSLSISSLTKSLNSDMPRVRVLDAALSLMCFKTPEVFATRIECLVRTIVSVLSSSVYCQVLHFDEGNSVFLRIGSSSSVDCDDLVRVGADLLESLEDNSDTGLSHTLLYAILKAAVSSSSFHMPSPSSSVFNDKNGGINSDRKNAISKLMCFLPGDFYFSNNEIPLRLLLWYLDPLILKEDVTQILREGVERPFLYLKKELHSRLSWRSIILCLVTSPTMFLETRALLHGWFLLTGLASVLNLKIAIISSILDVLSRPIWWGVSMEMGLKYPFSHAYFPNKHSELLAILSGPISCERFMDLVCLIGQEAISTSKYSDSSMLCSSYDSFQHEEIVNAIDSNSAWAILMDFPDWFYFAAILIFCEKDAQSSCSWRTLYTAFSTGETNIMELQRAAVLYLSWILCPIDEAYRNLMTDRMQEISRAWVTKDRANCNYGQPSYTDNRDKKPHTRSKKLRIPKVNEYEKLQSSVENDCSHTIGPWLKEFDGLFVDLCTKTIITHVPAEDKEKQIAGIQSSLLFTKIPLGILITSSNYLDEKGCEMLLHYASSGEILHLEEMEKKTQGYLSHDLALLSMDGRPWALNGACLVFNLFDTMQDMLLMLSDCEDAQADFICQVKGKISGYLLKCVKALLELPIEHQIQIDKVGERAKMGDLFGRMTKWMQQGRKVFEGYRAFDDVIDEIARRYTILEQN